MAPELWTISERLQELSSCKYTKLKLRHLLRFPDEPSSDSWFFLAWNCWSGPVIVITECVQTTIYGSHLVSCRRNQDGVIKAIEERLAVWTGLPPSHQEDMQVLR